MVILGVVDHEHRQPPCLMSNEGVHAGLCLLLSLLPGLGPLELDPFNDDEFLGLDGLKVDIDSFTSQRCAKFALRKKYLQPCIWNPLIDC